jgi:hypothetical protein
MDRFCTPVAARIDGRQQNQNLASLRVSVRWRDATRASIDAPGGSNGVQDAFLAAIARNLRNIVNLTPPTEA